MITLTKGNLLESDAQAFVNTVNCVGIMGKGIALQFKKAFPENYDEYARACKKGEVRIGKMFVYKTNELFNPKYIINFPTKRHWKSKSKIDDIKKGLDDLIRQIELLGIKSIAIPPLGSGLGGLNWTQVKHLIESAFKATPNIAVQLYQPLGPPKADKILIRTKKPNMTKGRALLIKALDLYRSQGYRHSLLEIQKLMFFLQEAGEKLQLNFRADQFGPYADNLHHVLQHMDGHYIRGYGDRVSRPEIYLIGDAMEKATAFLTQNKETEQRFECLARLIRGFETPYGMELLATVYWVVREYPDAAEDAGKAIEKVRNWNDRKKNLMKPNHIKKAWERLKSENWFTCKDGTKIPSKPNFCLNS